jgi:hypothetical protein
VIGPGVTLVVLASRYGTTVEALRQVNPELQSSKPFLRPRGIRSTCWRAGMAPAPEPYAKTIRR